jgi:Fic family protein
MMNHFGICKRGDEVLGFKTLKLKTEKDRNFFYNKIALKGLRKELEELIKQIKDFNVSDELFSSLDFEMGKDQQNLTKGYLYVLGRKEINKDNVKELYDILSAGLLDDYSIENMGEYYREKDVYILDNNHSFIESYTKGMDASLVDDKMNDLFDYINKDDTNDLIEIYIKSQIMHYYISYVHPYFDVNGRTARTTAMWYLIKENVSPFILFNRGIYKNRADYKKAILKCTLGDITPFIEFSLKTLKKELEEFISYEDTTTKIR